MLQILPSATEFSAHAKACAYPRVYTELLFDCITPVYAYHILSQHYQNCCILESSEQHESQGRYSFVGMQPVFLMETWGTRVQITTNTKGKPQIAVQNSPRPLEVLQEQMDLYAPPPDSALPTELCGSMGYVGYDLVRSFESLPDSNPAVDTPDIWMMIPGIVLVFDNLHKKLRITIRCSAAENQAYQRARDLLGRLVELLHTPAQHTFSPRFVSAQAQEPLYTSNMSAAEFQAAVLQAKKRIVDGDVFQVVISQRFCMELGDTPPFEVYRSLRALNPSPFSFFLDCGAFHVVGSSPEVMVLRKADKLLLRPIAGTVPRGVTEEEDKRLEEELLGNPKEIAEHMMLIDLGRNDLGRLCEFGSVIPTKEREIENYSHVKHIVSTIEGRLRGQPSLHDIFRATFPAGTLSGAPKVKAMEIIDELEVSRRGVYGGAILNLEFSGDITSCITIRTAVIQKNQAFIQAGAGIVYDSIPEKEYQETLNKARALMMSIAISA